MDPDHRTLQGGLVHQYAAAGFIENRKGDSTTSKTLEYAVGDFGDFGDFGDAQNELSSKWAPVVKQAYERCPDAVGSVNTGDLVNTSGDDSEWRDWFGAMDGYSQATNLIAAPGNHEYAGDTFRKKWKATFEYPDNGPRAIPARDDTPAERQRAAYEAHMAEALAETAYHTDYQGVRFLSLNAGTGDARQSMTPDDLPACSEGCPDPARLWLDMQGRWLDAAVEDNPGKWAVAVFHRRSSPAPRAATRRRCATPGSPCSKAAASTWC
ncbi:metallophosphoesterase family protein [Streptomyces cathayae]|uniref:Metallophosphoesterase n=1 Tax=Streptomyces cathayae TaxID=3031124 RepID=A0ABY8JS72_9ACTN|nr:metallophosphoesterase [Streptomyces sp. HUAS 5]WGD38835.1 metallophosphoesterase [Streptomyces sp. HUAS 5]